MKSKNLYYCPIDPQSLLFEEIYDEGVAFAYQPLQDPFRFCPLCGNVYFKKDCDVIVELFDSQSPDTAAYAAARRPQP